MAKARLVEIHLPDFGMPEASPEIQAPLYAARIARLRERPEANGVRLHTYVAYACDGR